MSVSQRIGLEPPFRAFGTGTCVDVEGPAFVNPLKRYSHYTKEACETECFVDFVIKFCNCRHFMHPGNMIKAGNSSRHPYLHASAG